MKTLLLTGGSRGIGHGTIKKFSSEGWRVLSCSRQSFDTSCPWTGGEENHIQIDLANPSELRKSIEVIRDRINGPLHGLINNAGISPKTSDGTRLDTINTSMEDWAEVFQVNFFAPIVLSRAFKHELVQAQGAIVNVTSIAGSRVHPFAGAAYATSKAALSALTREMAHDFGPLGVRVNAIAPGEIETPILSPGTDRIIKNLPLCRLGSVEEVANVIFFLCSEASSYVHGTELGINGGQHV